MSTKYTDTCLHNAGDEEPIFVLRAQDRLAPEVVEIWADLAEENGCSRSKVEGARSIARQMRDWPDRKTPD